MKKQEKIDFEKIIEHFGKEAQTIKIGEECCELSAVIFQSLCPTKPKKENEDKLYSELADVYNVMNQAMLIFDSERIKGEARLKRKKCIHKYILNQ